MTLPPRSNFTRFLPRLTLRFGRGAAALAAMIAIFLQLGQPVLHQHSAHAHAEMVDHAHDSRCHQHDESAPPQHDESTCPTCQLFASVRAYVPLAHSPSVVSVATEPPVKIETLAIIVLHQVPLTQAAPRAPPACC